MPKPVVLPGVKVGAIGDERDDAVIREPVAGPPEEALVHIVLVRLLGRARLDVGVLDTAVDFQV